MRSAQPWRAFSPADLAGREEHRGSAGAALVEVSVRFGLTGRVEGLQLADREATRFDDRRDVAVEVAAAGELLLDAVEAVLPCPHPNVRRTTVLDEVQHASRLENAAHL